jgi:hypothetical protein
MSGEITVEETEISEQTRILIGGAIIGALVGLAGAFLLVKNAERKGTELHVSTGEGVKLSLIVMGLLRQVADLA